MERSPARGERRSLAAALALLVVCAAPLSSGGASPALATVASGEEVLPLGAFAWGSAVRGQLGEGTAEDYGWAVPVLRPDGLAPFEDLTGLSGGLLSTLGLDAEGGVWSWGSNWLGGLGDGSPNAVSRSTPGRVAGPGGSGSLTGMRQVSASLHALALAENGTVWAWGENVGGQLGDGTTTQRTTPVQVVGPGGQGFLDGVDQVAAALGRTSAAVRADGTVWAWGENTFGQLGDGTTTRRTTPVQVVGSGGDGSLDDIVAVATGNAHVLALASDGTVWAWGANFAGQLGNGTTASSLTPVRVAGTGGEGVLEGVVDIATGGNFSLALDADGTVWSWGANSQGELGDGTATTRTSPVRVRGLGGAGFLTDAVDVHAGQGHALVARADGTVWAWGSNGRLQLGNGSAPFRTTPAPVRGADAATDLGGVVRIAGGYDQSLALTTGGTAWAWGGNQVGQLGNGIPLPIERRTPVRVHGPGGGGYLDDVVGVAGGWLHSVAVLGDGSAWSWGYNVDGQLGEGKATAPLHAVMPVRVRGASGMGFLTDVAQVEALRSSSFARKADGTVWAWGQNNIGQLGDGSGAAQSTPVQVRGPGGVGFLSGIVQISARASHTLALRSDGTVWAWGNNVLGQLGDGTFTTRTTPVQVKGPGGAGFLEGVVQVAAGGVVSYALAADGSVWAWGYNGDGALGQGSVTPPNIPTPVQVKGPGGTGMLGEVVEVAGGGGYGLARKTDGTVWTWGQNSAGQLGDGTAARRTTPVQVRGPGGAGFLTGASSIVGGAASSYAVLTDGTLWSWGSNASGRLGDGTTTTRLTPVQVRGLDGAGFLTGVRGVDAGDDHVLVVRAYRLPGVPAQVAATAGPAAGEIGLSWSPPDDDGGNPVLGYVVRAGPAPQDFDRTVRLGLVLEWSETGLPPATTRYYTVAAVTGVGEGEQTAPVSARSFAPPDAPRNLRAEPRILEGGVALAWEPPEDDGGAGVSEYIVYRATLTETEAEIARVDVAGYVDVDCRLGDVCRYRVAAANVLGEGPPSDEALALGTGIPFSPLLPDRSSSHRRLTPVMDTPWTTHGQERGKHHSHRR